MLEQLYEIKERRKIAIRNNPLFTSSRNFDKTALEIIFAQYWYPLHYFPDFLARAILLLPDLEDKSSVARVLSEELGDGQCKHAHEVAYFDALKLLGLNEETIRSNEMIPETERLMAGYRASSQDLSMTLGYFLSTEIADLWIVSNLGQIMLKNLPDRPKIPWITLHVTQEPGHVSDACRCLSRIKNSHDIDKALNYADQCSALWDEFFKGILRDIEARCVA